MHLPAEPEVWRMVRQKYDAKISVGIHMSDWNRGFALSPIVIAKLAEMGLVIDFDVYAYNEDDET